jgi:predicted Zn-dependent protease
MANALRLAVLSTSLACIALGGPIHARSGEKALAERTRSEATEGERVKSEMLAKYKVLEGTPFNDVMTRVFDRLMQVPEVQARDHSYEIFLVQSDEANAFCTQGGKIFVLSGITSILRNDEDMWAAVLGHEIAHAVRSHGYSQVQKAKRWSFATKLLGKIGDFAPGLGAAGNAARYASAAQTAGHVSQAMALSGPFAMRAFSRHDESDADAQGMLYMAKAGFDPQAAIRFHEELMERFQDSPAFLTFLHTHPREAVRMERLQSLVPTVREIAASAAPGQVQEVPIEAD